VHGHKHVSDLEQLSFFVLDAADRMVQQVGAYSLCASPTLYVRLGSFKLFGGIARAWRQACV
jgi:hypothetical protein